MEHTKEPWEAVETRVYLGREGGFDLRCAPAAEANARRIVACVNACAGIADPINTIPSLLRGNERLLALEKQLAAAQEELASNAKLLAIAERALRGIAATSGGLPSDIAVEAIAAIDAARNKNA